jgi:hypothetical protein
MDGDGKKGWINGDGGRGWQEGDGEMGMGDGCMESWGVGVGEMA